MKFRLILLGLAALAVAWWYSDYSSINWWYGGFTSLDREKEAAKEKEFAACQMKEMELYKGMDLAGEPALYTQRCMRAAGYLADRTCHDLGLGALADCYYPDTPAWRRIKEKQGAT
jgi:hypothetical protein